MPATTLKLAGSPVSMTELNLFPSAMSLRLGGISTLSLVRRGGALPGLPDPILGKTVELAIDGVLRFAGDVVDSAPRWEATGWTVVYQCRDLRARGDRVPFTDSNTLTDAAEWNLPPDQLGYMASRAGRAVGEILADALTMADNAANLHAKGIGGYVSLAPPELPAATLADLAALTMIPPTRVSIGGERLLGAIESFLSAWAPNHALQVRPDGVLRFLDSRATANRTLTLDVDPITPSPLSRSVADCFGAVLVRGEAIAEPKLPTLKNGGLLEDFAWGSLSNAAAKAAYVNDDFLRDEAARSAGTCVCSDSQTVVLTSNPGSQAWAAGEWDQTNRRGVLYVWDNTIAGVDQYVARRVVANTAKTGGGTSTFTLDAPLPAVSYNNYVLYGVSSGASLVYRKYKVADPALAAAIARQFTYPAPFVGASGGVAYMTSFPVGSVCWSADGNPPYNEVPAPFDVNHADGTLIFAQPTYITAGNRPPDDVRALLPVNTGSLRARRPAVGFEGTAHAIDGLAETLVVTVASWRDPANQSRVEEYARDLLDSVKDAVVEGSVAYNGLYADALDFGIGLSIAGSDYVTGWEGLNVPVVEVEVAWNSGAPWDHATIMRCSNRRNHYASTAFLREDRPPAELGGASPIPGVGQGNQDQFTAEAHAERAAAAERAAQGARTDQAGRDRAVRADQAPGDGGFMAAAPEPLAAAGMDFGADGPTVGPYKPRTNADRIASAKARREKDQAASAKRVDDYKAGNQARLDRRAAKQRAQTARAAERIAARGELVGPPKPSAVERLNGGQYPADRQAGAERLRHRDAVQRGLDWANQADPAAGARMAFGPADGGQSKARERAEIEKRNRDKDSAREQRRLDDQSRRGD